MIEWTFNNRRFYIREARSEAEFHMVEELQREAWGFSDLDIVPAATLIATQHAGGMVLGAFEGERMIGFAHGFPGYENGQASIHSHMLAVRPDCRNLHAGFFLKLAQRAVTLEEGLRQITWTFDPLQSLNAHLNFAKLGVISRRYVENFYGEETSSPLHKGFGTDRLWVSWLLDSDRVSQRIAQSERQIYSDTVTPAPTGVATRPDSFLIQREGDYPHLNKFDILLSENQCLIEIPRDITALKQRDPSAARLWREATRSAFQASIGAGFFVRDFVQFDGSQGRQYCYLLCRESI